MKTKDEYAKTLVGKEITSSGLPYLYKTQWGYRTLDDAYELYCSGFNRPKHAPKISRPIIDNYSASEDRFIDANGFGSGLN